MATKKASANKDVANKIQELSNELALEMMNEVETKLKISRSSAATQYRISTGSLALDLLSGGGMTPGMYTFFGWEQTAKTTTALNIIASTIPRRNEPPKVPILSFWDFENGAQDPDWLETILQSMGTDRNLDEIFGERDSKGNYKSPPLLNYQDEGTGELFFRWLAMLERRLPDKVFLEDSWWFVYDESKKSTLGDLVDQRMTKTYEGGLYVKAPDGSPQAVVLVDSYPAMIPESVDENIESGKNDGLGVVARMFATELPKVKGRLRKKRIILIGINQLRDIPMAMYGPKDQEAAGKAVRFFSDSRYRFDSLAISGVKAFSPKGEGQIESEESTVKGAVDKYRYIRVRAFKNKNGPQAREVWLRLWLFDHENKPRGFDTMFDTMFYLKETGQVTGNRKDLKFKLGEKEFSMPWKIAKHWIVGTKEARIKINERFEFPSNFNLRKFCFNQVAVGKGTELYNSTKAKNATAPSGD